VVTAWLNGKHVVIGKVLEGMEVVRAIENVPTNSFNHPIQECVITASGTLPVLEPFDVPKE